MKVYNVDQAREFFIDHSEESVICVKNEIEKICSTLQEAEDFFMKGGE